MNRLGIISFSLLLAIPAWTQEVQEFVGAGGVVNWSNGTVSAQGNGLAASGTNPKTASFLACRAAVVDAQRNLLEAIQGVRVTSTTVVQDFALESDEIRTTLEGVVKGASMLERKTNDDGVCTVVLRMPMGGKMSTSVYQASFGAADDAVSLRLLPSGSYGALLGEAMRVSFRRTAARGFGVFPMNLPWVSPVQAASGSEKWAEAYESLAGRVSALEQQLDTAAPAEKSQVAVEKLPTGLVVDARGSNFIPSLSPNIRQLRGGIIYPNSKARNSILGSGNLVALFARNVDFAMRHPRVGERPLLIKGLRTWGDTRTEIVLGEESAAKVVALAKTDFFTGAGVIIILD